jgi:hypothetical protein
MRDFPGVSPIRGELFRSKLYTKGLSWHSISWYYPFKLRTLLTDPVNCMLNIRSGAEAGAASRYVYPCMMHSSCPPPTRSSPHFTVSLIEFMIWNIEYFVCVGCRVIFPMWMLRELYKHVSSHHTLSLYDISSHCTYLCKSIHFLL